MASGSVVVEENVSSPESGGEEGHSNGGGHSESSGVYKNIIINLGNLMSPERHQVATSAELEGFFSPPPPQVPPLPESVALLTEGGGVNGRGGRSCVSAVSGQSEPCSATNGASQTSVSGSVSTSAGVSFTDQPLVGILKKSK